MQGVTERAQMVSGIMESGGVISQVRQVFLKRQGMW